MSGGNVYRLRARRREGKVRFVYGMSSRLGLLTCDVTGVGGGGAKPPCLLLW